MKIVLIVDIPEEEYTTDKVEQLSIFTFAANLAKYHLEKMPELAIGEQVDFDLSQLFTGTHSTLGKLA